MPYTHPIDFILVYSTWALVLLTVLLVTIYIRLKKAPGNLWAAALDEDQLRTSKDMTPQQFAEWIGQEFPEPCEDFGSDLRKWAAAGLPPKEFWEAQRINTGSPETIVEAPTLTPLSEAHQLLDTPEEPASKPVKRSRANMKPPAKRVRKAKVKLHVKP